MVDLPSVLEREGHADLVPFADELLRVGLVEAGGQWFADNSVTPLLVFARDGSSSRREQRPLVARLGRPRYKIRSCGFYPAERCAEAPALNRLDTTSASVTLVRRPQQGRPAGSGAADA